MITLIIKNYLLILISIGILLSMILIAGLYIIYRMFKNDTHCPAVNPMVATDPVDTAAQKEANSYTISSHDIHSIAGNDVYSTQLDLARAYIETGRENLAKKILQHIISQGDVTQQQEAYRLMTYLSDFS